MRKTILITGSTDGIGLEAAKVLAALGHYVVLHGRSPSKLDAAIEAVAAQSTGGRVEGLVADLSVFDDVVTLAEAVARRGELLDVLINNAGVYKVSSTTTEDGLDVRFVVNTIAPYLLTHRLLPLLEPTGRVINLSSAAQAPVDLEALAGDEHLSADSAYAQSKLALTMWSRNLALALEDGPAIVAVNPGSLLATNMVKEAYGIAGGNVSIGADILRRAALDDVFGAASGRYFDNDSGGFARPHPDGLDAKKCQDVVRVIEAVLDRLGHEVSSFG